MEKDVNSFLLGLKAAVAVNENEYSAAILFFISDKRSVPLRVLPFSCARKAAMQALIVTEILRKYVFRCIIILLVHCPAGSGKPGFGGRGREAF